MIKQQITPEELTATVDRALAQRLKGNEFFKAGELQNALREYHSVLLHLKGLDSTIQQVFGAEHPPPEVNASAADATTDAGDTTSKEPTLHQRVKNAVTLVYLNSAAIHIKNEKFKRALECAQEALKLDEKNTKATFREAQARIGLGEITKGKQMLEDLNKKSPDVAFSNALKKLAIDEKARDAKKSSQFKGMYTKKSPAASTPATAATPPPPAAAPVAEQMSTAPVVKDKTPMVDLTTSESSEFTG